MTTAVGALAEAFAHHRAGRLNAAEAIYRDVLAGQPDNADALHHLGLIAAAHGRLADADQLMSRSAELNPANRDWQFNVGRLAALRGDLVRARIVFQRLAESDPADIDAQIALGSVLVKARCPADARTWLAKALARAPNRADAMTALGVAELEAGSATDAERLCRDAVRRAPEWADAHSNLGYVLRRLGRHREAESACRGALALDPDHADALINLGLVLQSLRRAEEAIACFERALAVRPDSEDARYGLGTALLATGRHLEARSMLDAVIAQNPRNWSARWSNLVALPVVPRSDAEIEAERRRYSDELGKLERDVESHLATDARDIAAAIGLGANFHLHYTIDDMRDLQARYGALITRVARAAYPECARPLSRSPAAGRRVRVGFASSFLHRHSIAKTHGCWISDLPRDRFEVVVFQLAGPSDDRTAELMRDARWHDCTALDQAALVARIADEQLDALIWPDIGMDPAVQIPAALRLAPVQAVGIGHPVTTGLAEVDAFLSSAAMEAPDSEGQYTETLVRLPNLSVAYPWPRESPGACPAMMQRLRDSGRVVFLCAQSLFKLRPAQDDVFARILAEVAEATLVLISHPAPAVTEVVRARLAERLRARGLAPDRVAFLPRLSQEDFLAANAAADVVLDSFGWSGFNSTMEALAMGVPVVTCPGRTVRARHAYGVLRMAGLDELVAGDVDSYVALAARLGRDGGHRRRMREAVARSRATVFDDPTAVPALAAWIERAVSTRVAG